MVENLEVAVADTDPGPVPTLAEIIAERWPALDQVAAEAPPAGPGRPVRPHITWGPDRATQQRRRQTLLDALTPRRRRAA